MVDKNRENPTSIYEFEGRKVTYEQAYNAMFAYLSSLYRRTKNDEIGGILGDLSLLPDGTTADPAAIMDWLECMDQSIGGKVDSRMQTREGVLIVKMTEK